MLASGPPELAGSSVSSFESTNADMLSSSRLSLRATTVAPFRQGLRESGHTAIELSVRPDAAPVGRTPKLTCGCHGAAVAALA